MDTFNAIVDAALKAFYQAFRWSPGLGLALISAASGAAMLWIFRHTSNQPRIHAVKRLVQAHLLELRLYQDEPGIVWRAQKSLMAANLRYLALMLQPALVMAIPFAILLVHLESFYGRAPVRVGADTIVTMELRGGASALPRLEAPAGVAVETPGVRALDVHQVSWRIRPESPVSGRLRILVDGQSVERSIEAGSGPRFVPGRNVHSTWEAVWHPGESRITAPDVDWVEVRYPGATVEWLGIRMHWLAWFFLVSMVSALLLKKRFQVTF